MEIVGKNLSHLNKTNCIFCDFHIHSKYSRATSKRMDIESIAHFAKLKGLDLVGTGDFTHPKWIEALRNSLLRISDTDLYRLKAESNAQPCFMITGEVNTIFFSEKKTKKIHHLILTPNLEIAEQINDKLRIYGDLSVDGRPTLKMTASELVEKIMEISKDNVLIPAHIWTPWYSLFGSINGFDRIEDCYEDMTRHIFALETGLSSDPPMNWRLSSLDKYTLISNSDSHSPYPYRLGREANVFDIKELSYGKILEAIQTKDSKRLKFTIETNPAYGKYHWTGHRKCGVSMPSSESKKIEGRCPVCRKRMTRGVDERVDDLADRSYGFRSENIIDFFHLLPLHETISAVLGVNTLSSSSVWRRYNILVATFGDEYSVLLEAPLKALEKVVEPKIAEAIVKIRSNEVTIAPGYDGVYGKIKLFEEKNKFQIEEKSVKQSNLKQFV